MSSPAITSPPPIYRTSGIRAIEAAAVPGAAPPLMERAGLATADLTRTLLGGGMEGKRVLVLCGPGNNGGDGLVAARHLRALRADVCCVLAGDAAGLPKDAQAALSAWHAAGGETRADFAGADWDAALDGLLGIGLARPVEGALAGLVARFNALPCLRIAIDMPSGVDSDTGAALGTAVRATHTITFIARKPGQLTLDGPDHCGHLSVNTIGLEPSSIRAPDGYLNSVGAFADSLAPRPLNSHKGTWGSLGIIGGATGTLGAALLAGRAALKLGAGRVYVGLLDDRAAPVDPLQPELMLRSAADVLALPWLSALAVGPGLGQSAQASRLLDEAMAQPIPLVLDADALNLVASSTALREALRTHSQPALLTPHPAEAARLLACSVQDVQADRVQAAQELTTRFNAGVVLKGCGSVVALPGGRWYINPTGNPGMASAGMGDVLTGMAGSLLAQDWEPADALTGATWLHGAAADACVAAGAGPVGLTAGELVEPARSLLNRLCMPGGLAA